MSFWHQTTGEGRRQRSQTYRARREGGREEEDRFGVYGVERKKERKGGAHVGPLARTSTTPWGRRRRRSPGGMGGWGIDQITASRSALLAAGRSSGDASHTSQPALRRCGPTLANGDRGRGGGQSEDEGGVDLCSWRGPLSWYSREPPSCFSGGLLLRFSPPPPPPSPWYLLL